MLGNILRTIRGVEVSRETLAADVIHEVTQGEGHYLGHAQTLARMETDYLYPEIGDRRTPREWSEDGAVDARTRARRRAREILDSHFPATLEAELDAALRQRYDIMLPNSKMNPG